MVKLGQGILLEKLNKMYIHFFKRALDILFAILALLFLFLVYLVLIILVRIKLGGPVLFKQVRPGKNGKLFKLYKFRSMTNKTDENGNLLPDEQRLTKFGKKLRSSSLDELPEIINILKGDMSFIGPRPQLVKDYVFFDEEVMKRQSVRPGLSGLAQVNGRNNISWEKKFEYDLQYVKKVTFLKDLGIFFKTIGKVFKRSDIDKDGFATDEDYGDYLLRTNKINDDYYNQRVSYSKELVDKF